MEKVIDYMNWSTQIFCGFYESYLWHSDSIIDLTYGEPEPPSGYEYDLRDFSGYCEEIAEKALDLIWDNVPDEDGIILGMKFTGVSSPKYYNFSTDKLCAEVTVDYDALKKYCLVENREDFDKHLHDNFTSYDGFWSFVANNVTDFESELESESEKYDNVMIEYYLLNLDYMKDRDCDLSPYLYDLMDYYVNPAQWERLCLYKDGKYYDYTVDEESESVVVGDEIK